MLLFGLLALLEARKLTMGTLERPEPGFFPFYLAMALCVVSLPLLVRGIWAKAGTQTTIPRAQEWVRWEKTVYTLVALLGYAFVLEKLGFLLATFLMLSFLFKAVERQSWRMAAGGSIAIAALTYSLFKWLGVQLPSSPWGP